MRRTDGLAEQSLGNFDAATDNEAAEMARAWAGRDGVLAWQSWVLVIADSGRVIASYAATDDRIVFDTPKDSFGTGDKRP